MRSARCHIYKMLAIVICLFLPGCAGDDGPRTMSPKKATSRPYTIKGITYYPQQHYEYKRDGIASHYGDGDGFQGKSTATGDQFNTNDLTAAHQTLPLPCVILVTNLENGRSIKLKVNDRGPFVGDRMLDVSRKAAQLLGFYQKGLAMVRVETLVPESVAMGKKKRKARLPARYSETKFAPKKIAEVAVTPPKAKKVPVVKMPRLPHAAPKHGGLYVQAGRFATANNAKNFAHKMQQVAPSKAVKLKSGTTKNKNPYAVRFGPFKSGQEAKNLIRHMNKVGCKNAFVVME